jgi:cytochrome c553
LLYAEIFAPDTVAAHPSVEEKHLSITSIKEQTMKLKAVMMIGTLMLSGVAAYGADDGAALYKQKCVGCHGASGEGKPAMKAPALKGTSQSEDQITERLVKGVAASRAPHKKGMAGLTEAQAKAIAAHVKTL